MSNFWNIISVVRALVPKEMVRDLLTDGIEIVVSFVVVIWFLLTQVPNMFAVILLCLFGLAQAVKVYVWVKKVMMLRKAGKLILG